jgi:dual specificity phosphatase 12
VALQLDGTQGRFVCKKIGLLDVEEEDLLGHIPEALAFIEDGLRAGGVLVHCVSGMSRSAAMVAAWLIKTEGLSACDALVKVQERRPIVDPNEGFRRQLILYAESASLHFTSLLPPCE